MYLCIMDLSRNIKALRESKNIKQVDVAKALNLDPSYYFRLEKRGDKLSIEQLEKIAQVLGVSVVELMTGQPQKVKDERRVEELQKEIIALNEKLNDKNKWLEDKEELIKIKDLQLANIQESGTSFIYSHIVDYFAKENNFDYLGVKIINLKKSKADAILNAKDIEELPESTNFMHKKGPWAIRYRYALKHQLDSNEHFVVTFFMYPSKRLHVVDDYVALSIQYDDQIAPLLFEVIGLGFTNDAILNFIYMKYKRGDYEGITILSEEHEEELGKSYQERMLLSEEEKQKNAIENKKTFELEFESYLTENKERLKHEPERIFRGRYSY